MKERSIKNLLYKMLKRKIRIKDKTYGITKEEELRLRGMQTEDLLEEYRKLRLLENGIRED